MSMTAVPISILRRARADRGEQRERRAELAREVMHAEIRAVGAELLRRDRELDRLAQRVGRRSAPATEARASSARTTRIRSSSLLVPTHVKHGARRTSRSRVTFFRSARSLSVLLRRRRRPRRRRSPRRPSAALLPPCGFGIPDEVLHAAVLRAADTNAALPAGVGEVHAFRRRVRRLRVGDE